MLYPAYVHKDEHSAYGLSFPDFPGCFAAADHLNGIPRAAQEAVEAHFGADDDAIPAPTSPEQWNGHNAFEDGYWMLVDIDLGKVRDKAVRVNVSLAESLLHRVDVYTRQHHLSRSALIAAALEREMDQRRAP